MMKRLSYIALFYIYFTTLSSFFQILCGAIEIYDDDNTDKNNYYDEDEDQQNVIVEDNNNNNNYFCSESDYNEHECKTFTDYEYSKDEREKGDSDYYYQHSDQDYGDDKEHRPRRLIKEKEVPYPWTDLYNFYGCDDLLYSTTVDRRIYTQSDWTNLRKAYINAMKEEEDSSSIRKRLSDENGFHVPIYVDYTTNGAGRGVFAAERIKEGTLVYTSLTQRATFKSGKVFLEEFLIKSLMRNNKNEYGEEQKREYVCDLLSWCHTSFVGSGEYIIDKKDPSEMRIVCVLDEGSFVNEADRDHFMYNLGCPEYYINDYYFETNYPDERSLRDNIDAESGGCRINFYALRDIEKHEEIRSNYGEYIEFIAWDLVDAWDIFEW